MSRRARPTPPRPDLIRRPAGSFGWLEARLLHEGWLARLGPQAAAVLLLLALAADRQGASFFGRARMAYALAIPRRDLDQALDRLIDLGLIAHRPWRPGDPDGVWQILPLLGPAPAAKPAPPGTLPLRAALAALGFTR